jgi:pimeloyl-ACP methyl ester carboxylesterase
MDRCRGTQASPKSNPNATSHAVMTRNSTLIIAGAIATLAALTLSAAVAFRVPEIPMATLRAKYAGPTSRYLTLKDGAVIHLREEGPRQAPVILMVPGLHSPLHVWNAWMAALRDEYRVIAVDLPGQGLSDSWPRNDYSIAALDSFISEVTSALGVSRFTLAGHSMSGAMAWRYALAHPERVEALILVSAGGFVAEGAGPILSFRVLASPIVGPLARQFMVQPMVRRLLRQSYGDADKVSEELVARYFETINGAGHRASLGARLNYLMSYQPVSLIKAVHAPTLIVWGDKDQLRPVLYASMFHEHIKGSVPRVHRGIGHFPMEEAPQATTADVREFMRRLR